MKKIVLLILLIKLFSVHGQDSLLQTGQRYLEAGRNDLALEALSEAEQNLTDLNSLTAAQCYNDLGVIYFNNGNHETALDYLEKGLAIREDLLESDAPPLADSYINLGLFYTETEFLQAIIYFDKALEIYKKVYGENHEKIAFCYTNMAFAHRFQKNYQDALAFMDLTLGVWRKLTKDDHPSKALTLSNKGIIYQQQGNYDQALELQQEALNQYLRLYGPKHPEVANTYSLIGSVYSKKKDFGRSVASFQQSIYANLYDQDYSTIYDLPEIKGYYNASYLLASLMAKAQAMEADHFEHSLKPRDIEGSLATYKKCDELITQMRQSRLSDKDKIRLGNTAAKVYDNGIRIALYLSNKTFRKEAFKKTAFTFCERSKSATLLEAINETKAKSFAGIPDELIQLEDSLKAEISWLEKEVAKGGSEAEKQKEELFNYLQAYRSFISRLEADFPNYFKLKYEQQEITVEQVMSEIPQGTALLSYFTGSDAVYIFYLTNQDFKIFDYPKNQQLAQLASGMRNSIKYQVSKGFAQSARKLYQQLIPPIGKEIQQLVILPDGILGTIPFEALLIEGPVPDKFRFLIEDYAISYDYAASLYLDKRSAGKQQRDVTGIFLSAPVSFEQNELKMPTLPGSEKEVQQIRYLFLSGADQPTVCLKEQASESSIKSDQLSDYRYLHFATHGIVNESRPELSRIFLTPDRGEDGSLYSGEIYNLSINADLVTLSACETGLGKVEKGEGILGLSRSLTYAGAKNLIVSLWQVADESTAQLMIDFYTQHLHHSDNLTFADDLRKAKLNFINGEKFNDPYYWAPFILIGQ